MTAPAASAIVLVGPMGAGKTSIGKRVAKILELGFVDTDAIVVRSHGPIADIFTTHGEARFRELEREAVTQSLAQGGVVSLGGGSVLDPDTRADLRAHRVALLTVSPAIVAGRIGGGHRPLLAAEGEDPVARWRRILDERMPLYTDVADATFDTSHGPLSDVVDQIVAWARTAAPKGHS
ncbi:shikimate kinase [Microbacterium sp. RG1]|uniref:shikimate kinase n=1 Tax=Microbacterium sp. RG1 TaxID=2489212 RepID=UPI0010CA42BA|nr:shikimate kinase [Microbacterium sp. RG1]QCQ15990.1 AAA family ATPase [Microbacterium sp. RG1]